MKILNWFFMTKSWIVEKDWGFFFTLNAPESKFFPRSFHTAYVNENVFWLESMTNDFSKTFLRYLIIQKKKQKKVFYEKKWFSTKFVLYHRKSFIIGWKIQISWLFNALVIRVFIKNKPKNKLHVLGNTSNQNYLF